MDNLNNFELLYELNKGKYQRPASWVNCRDDEFVPMFPVKDKNKFVSAPLLNDRQKFTPSTIEQIGTGGGIRTHDSRIKSPLL